MTLGLLMTTVVAETKSLANFHVPGVVSSEGNVMSLHLFNNSCETVTKEVYVCVQESIVKQWLILYGEGMIKEAIADVDRVMV
ncbi:hypothetical protein J437_LFUL014745 [Ladona fulva]|uniref:Uncharacterized protein n=1 Tax=Ladona fulva TaxID=123851 RepID=A0A8K0P6N3_LADFU|nr:hypothetical protein J437_LFUL014745 [Ladona fulva]